MNDYGITKRVDSCRIQKRNKKGRRQRRRPFLLSRNFIMRLVVIYSISAIKNLHKKYICVESLVT